MGHGSRVYFRVGIRNLGKIGVGWGLDKIFHRKSAWLRSLGFARDTFGELSISALGSDAS